MIHTYEDHSTFDESEGEYFAPVYIDDGIYIEPSEEDHQNDKGDNYQEEGFNYRRASERERSPMGYGIDEFMTTERTPSVDMTSW